MKENSLIKKDCIQFDKEGGHCRGLKYLFCKDARVCPFYKSEKIFNADGTRKENAPCKAS